MCILSRNRLKLYGILPKYVSFFSLYLCVSGKWDLSFQTRD